MASHRAVNPSPTLATIGITDFAVQSLTDLVYVQLPAVGRKVTPGEAFGEVESVKAVSDLYAPVAGEVIEVNTKVKDDLGKLSDEPFEGGWLVKLRITAGDPLSGLLDRAGYEKLCAEQGH